jgi:hypothetical protein
MGQPLGLLGDAIRRESLDCLGDASVQGTLSVVEQPGVRDFVGERVLEGIFQIGKEPGFVEKLCGLQTGELDAHLLLRRFGDGQEQRHGHVFADDCGDLE